MPKQQENTHRTSIFFRDGTDMEYFTFDSGVKEGVYYHASMNNGKEEFFIAPLDTISNVTTVEL